LLRARSPGILRPRPSGVNPKPREGSRMKLRDHLGCACLALACLSGCTGSDADHLAQIGRKTVGRAGHLTGGDSGGWHMVRAGLDDITLDSRVAARLRWDKSLADAAIQVKTAGGIV